MLHRYPVGEMVRKVLAGSGECAQVNWTFLHLSIAEWSLICFVLFVIYIIWVTRVTARRPAW
jgi:disulfide bond formation protein DsbB